MSNNRKQIEESMSSEVGAKKYEISCVRISNVSDYLLNKNPSLIDFKLKTPLIPYIDFSTFEKYSQSSNKFNELPKFIKELVEKAEHVKYYDLKFRKYLSYRDISPKEYSNKNPKKRQDLFYEWLFSNHMDEGILEL